MKKKNIPNMISIVRITAAPIVAAFLWSGNLIIGLPLYVIAALTDLVDGKLARKWNVQSVEGKYLDMLADKIFAAIMLITLIPSNISLLAPLFMETAIGTVSYQASRKQHNTSSAMIGKIKTAVLSAMMGGALLGQYVSQIGQLIPFLVVSTLGFQVATLHHYVMEYKKEEKRLQEHPEELLNPSEDQITSVMRKSDLSIHFVNTEAIRKLYHSHLYRDYINNFANNEEIEDSKMMIACDETEKRYVKKK